MKPSALMVEKLDQIGREMKQMRARILAIEEKTNEKYFSKDEHVSDHTVGNQRDLLLADDASVANK